MGQALIKKTLCILNVSPYQQDMMDDWFTRWDAELQREEVEVEPHGILGVLQFWNVEGPHKAFAELPREVFASSYRAILAGTAPTTIDLE